MNNDRFKFRVWNGRNYISEKDSEYLWMTLDGIVMRPHSDDYEGESVCVMGNAVLEQCTGLKDENGRLIYENDLVRMFGFPEPGVVIWLVSEYRVKFRNHSMRFVSQRMEIIGNIHENPELLEAK